MSAKTKKSKKNSSKKETTLNVTMDKLLDFSWLRSKPDKTIDEQIEVSKRMREAAMLEVNQYLKNSPSNNNPDSLLFDFLHNLDRDYYQGQLMMEGCINSLIQFFLFPENSAAYQKKFHSAGTEELIKCLLEMQYFLKLLDNQQAKAQFDRMALRFSKDDETEKVLETYSQLNWNSANAYLSKLRKSESQKSVSAATV